MFKLDNNFLISMGLGGLPVEEKNRLLQAIYERLEVNVGMKLTEHMTEAQLSDLERFIDNRDETGAMRWMEVNFPHYREVVAGELNSLKLEISNSAPQILEAARAIPSSESSSMTDPVTATSASGVANLNRPAGSSGGRGGPNNAPYEVDQHGDTKRKNPDNMGYIPSPPLDNSESSFDHRADNDSNNSPKQVWAQPPPGPGSV